MYFYSLILKILCITCIFASNGLFTSFRPTPSSPHHIVHNWKDCRYWICLIIGVWEHNVPGSKTHDLQLMHLHSCLPSEFAFSSPTSIDDDLQWWMTVKFVKSKMMIKALWIQQGLSMLVSAGKCYFLNWYYLKNRFLRAKNLWVSMLGWSNKMILA